MATPQRKIVNARQQAEKAPKWHDHGNTGISAPLNQLLKNMQRLLPTQQVIQLDTIVGQLHQATEERSFRIDKSALQP